MSVKARGKHGRSVRESREKAARKAQKKRRE